MCTPHNIQLKKGFITKETCLTRRRTKWPLQQGCRFQEYALKAKTDGLALPFQEPWTSNQIQGHQGLQSYPASSATYLLYERSV
jgi:hypothetical protein